MELAINSGARKRNRAKSWAAPAAKTPLNGQSGRPKSAAAAKPVKKRGLFQRRKFWGNAPASRYPRANAIEPGRSCESRDDEDGTAFSDDWYQTSRENLGTYETAEGSFGTLETGEHRPIEVVTNYLTGLCGDPSRFRSCKSSKCKSTAADVLSELLPSPETDGKPASCGSEFVNELKWLQGFLCGTNARRPEYSLRVVEATVQLDEYHDGKIPRPAALVERATTEEDDDQSAIREGSDPPSRYVGRYACEQERDNDKIQDSDAEAKTNTDDAEPSASELTIPKPAATVKSSRAKSPVSPSKAASLPVSELPISKPAATVKPSREKPDVSPSTEAASPSGEQRESSEQVIVEVTLDHYDALKNWHKDVAVMGNEIAQLEEERLTLLTESKHSNVDSKKALVKKNEELQKLKELVRSVTQANSELQQAIQEQQKLIEDEQAMREKALLEKGSLTTALHDMERQLLKSKTGNGKSISDMVMSLVYANKADRDVFTLFAEDEIDDAISTVVWDRDAYAAPTTEKNKVDVIDEEEEDDDEKSCVSGRTGFWTTLSHITIHSFGKVKAARVDASAVPSGDIAEGTDENASQVTDNREISSDGDSVLGNVETFQDSYENNDDQSKGGGSFGQFSKDLEKMIKKDLEDADRAPKKRAKKSLHQPKKSQRSETHAESRQNSAIKTSQNKSKRNNPFARMTEKLSTQVPTKGSAEAPAPTVAGATPPTLRVSFPSVNETDTESYVDRYNGATMAGRKSSRRADKEKFAPMVSTKEKATRKATRKKSAKNGSAPSNLTIITPNEKSAKNARPGSATGFSQMSLFK